MSLSFGGHSVLITGATGALGQTVTRAFLDAGATVGGIARKWAPPAVPKGDFLAIEADLTGPAAAEASVEALISRAGKLDAVIHLMGGFAGGKPLQETDDATWDQLMNINLRSAFFVLRAALPRLLEKGKGRIVAVGSRAGQEPAAGMTAYAVSKAGLHALIRGAAAETRRTGVTVNAVLPSIIDTETNRQAMPRADYSQWVTPASVAGLLLWLASPEGADVNGALIPMYGGA
jgi:NAD(P)-dependent dehydrogenase (short-subunit alcohol dehydrogenase family)